MNPLGFPLGYLFPSGGAAANIGSPGSVLKPDHSHLPRGPLHFQPPAGATSSSSQAGVTDGLFGAKTPPVPALGAIGVRVGFGAPIIHAAFKVPSSPDRPDPGSLLTADRRLFPCGGEARAGFLGWGEG